MLKTKTIFAIRARLQFESCGTMMICLNSIHDVRITTGKALDCAVRVLSRLSE